MCEDNDKIMEGLAQEIIEKSPNLSQSDLKIAVDKAFESLPEPDFDEEEKDEN